METILVGLTLVVMVGVLVLSIIPFIPGPILLWLVALGFGVLDDFNRLPLIVFGVMTVVMLLGSTTDLWTPLLGIRSDGVSCMGIVGTLIGGLVGTFTIPIPICSTVIGAVAGALLFEFLYRGDVQRALNAGRMAARSIVVGMILEFSASLLIFLLFLGSLYFTG